MTSDGGATPLTEIDLRLLTDWNNTVREYKKDKCVHELFELQAARTPDVIAVSFEGEGISYRELDKRSNQLGHYLRGLGVRSETLVGLCIEPSIEMIIGLLGILKAGGAYVPLDSALPSTRLAFFLRDSGAPLVVTQEQLLDLLPAEARKTVCLDRDRELISALNDSSLGRTSPPESALYVIYTSGSTGTPKAVVIEHRHMVNYVEGICERLELSGGLSFALLSSLGADLGNTALFPALATGGTLLPLSRERGGDPLLLGDYFRLHPVDFLKIVPSHLAALIAALPDPSLLPRRRLVLGGEAATWGLIDKVRGLVPECEIFNHYGPTETTVGAIAGPIGNPADPTGPIVPLGRPLPNVQVHILDPMGRRVPPGTPGEIYIGGDGVGRGYLRRPELTAASFVPDPFGTADGRLYRTGDVGRYLLDGTIEFLGRIDDQIKIRGFRIEPGEIESAIAEHPGVAGCVIRPHEDTPGDRRLVAYVVPSPTALQTVSDRAGSAANEHVDQWRMIYEQLYSNIGSGDPSFDTIGWNSSYTGESLPVEAMRESVDRTVERILGLDPHRAIEIGCGTGLLLFRIAPHCDAYIGTDFSGPLIDDLGRVLAARSDLSHVKLFARRADDFRGFVAASVDTVVLNSVVQYFPSADYLIQVLENSVSLVADGGVIFIGDVRSLPLLEVFHLSVELEHAQPSLPSIDLMRRIRWRVAQEEELVVDPRLFLALKARVPRIRRLEILPKMAGHDNELNRYRYDVVLRIGPGPRARSLEEWVSWTDQGCDLEGLRERLAAERPPAFGLRGIPNSRIAGEVGVLELLKGTEPPRTVGDLRGELARRASIGVDPSDIWGLADMLPYDVELSWASSGFTGDFDAAFRRRGGGGVVPTCFPGEDSAPSTYRGLSNNPLQGAVARTLVPELRSHLRGRLPEYMIPSSFVVLQEFPLLPNGKVDRRALPAPGPPTAEGTFAAPRNPVEEVLAGIWAQLLGVEKVGVEDDFFALGGHSLLATQVISRVRDAFRIEIPLQDLFEGPTVSRLAGRISLAMRRETGPPPPPMNAVGREGPVALSFAQQRLWFLDQLEPGSVFYVTSRVVRLRGDLNLRALKDAFEALVARHETLRTRFVALDGKPYQVVDKANSFRLASFDLTNLPGDEREAHVSRKATEESLRPFDLSADQLLRATLLRIAEREHVLIFAIHHIISDDWSVAVLMKELGLFYEQARQGRTPKLPALPVQYADFAHWQRSWLRGENLAKQISYWTRRLAGASVLRLPTDHPRPAAQSYRGARHSFSLPNPLVRSLKEVSLQEGVTLYMSLLAVFQVLLMRYADQEDIVVGSPIAGRNRGETEGLIGFFVNALVMRSDLSGQPTFRELLKRVRQIALGAYAHQDVPFEKLVEELQPERDLGKNPVFQVLFALQNAPAATLELTGVSAVPLSVESKTTHFDLEVELREESGGLTGTFVYATDLFESDTIARMTVHFQTLLEGAMADPDRNIWELSMLRESERRQVVEEWNRTEREYPRDKTVSELFEDQAQRIAGQVAVVFGHSRLTYGELNARANQLARYLGKRGVEPEVLVGLCVERSLEMVVGLLAILKAGGAYVPLDPAYPEPRLAFMLEDTKAPVVLTQERLSGALPEGHFQRVRLDADWPEIARESAENPPVRATPDGLAYVIYTSGSTGIPKGVAIEHHSAVALISWASELFSEGELDGVLASTSVCFDLSVFELFAPLAAGGKVVIARDALELPQLVAADEVRLVNTVPSAMTELLRIADLPDSVKTVNLAGEPLAESLVAEILKRGRVTRVFDLYGPTEDTTYSTCALRSGEGRATIGRPITNKRSYILDSRLQPVPIGVPGDLYVGGAGVARGYLNRPELTAERFLEDPFRPGDRMYRTGDRARFLPDGNIQFLGRLDHQVKVRGYRIEVGEIEEALSHHPEVLACAVSVREDGPEKRLVGYVVPREGTLPSVSGLRGFLKTTLPGYMIPSVFLFLDALPLTPNGKVDRRALPAPDQSRPALEDAFLGPRNPVEQTLAGIWAQVLGLDRVGIHDNFFELGGHSLLVTQIVSRLRDAFDVELPLRAIFQSPTVAGLAEAVSSTPARTSAAIAPVDRETRRVKAADLVRVRR